MKFKTKLWDGDNFSDKYKDLDLSTNESTPKQKKGGGDAAGIISASADGVRAVGDVVSMFTGGQPSQEPVEPPPTENNSNLWVIGGFSVVTIILLFLIFKSKKGNGGE